MCLEIDIYVVCEVKSGIPFRAFYSEAQASKEKSTLTKETGREFIVRQSSIEDPGSYIRNLLEKTMSKEKIKKFLNITPFDPTSQMVSGLYQLYPISFITMAKNFVNGMTKIIYLDGKEVMEKTTKEL